MREGNRKTHFPARHEEAIYVLAEDETPYKRLWLLLWLCCFLFHPSRQIRRDLLLPQNDLSSTDELDEEGLSMCHRL